MPSYAFTPIPDELADVLDEAVQGMSQDGYYCYHLVESSSEIEELSRLGFLDDVQLYIDGDCLVHVTSKGSRYRREHARWAEARAREREDEKARDRRLAKREWAIAAIGAAASILSAIVGYMIGAAR